MSRKKSLFNIILYFSFYIINSFFVLLFMELTNTSKGAITGYLVSNILLAILLISFNYRYLKRKLKQYRLYYISQAIIIYIIYTTTLIIFTLIIMHFNLDNKESVNQDSIDEMFKNGNVILMFIFISFIGPLIEEIIFRASMIHLITGAKLNQQTIKYKVALLFAGGFFVSLHVSSELTNFTGVVDLLVVAIPYILMTFGFIYMFHKSRGNIFSSLTLHILTNTIASIGLVLSILGG